MSKIDFELNSITSPVLIHKTPRRNHGNLRVLQLTEVKKLKMNDISILSKYTLHNAQSSHRVQFI